MLFQGGKQWLNTTMASRRKKIDQYFDDLEEVYFNMRQRDTLGSGEFASAFSYAAGLRKLMTYS
jgi:hypothetical protein